METEKEFRATQSLLNMQDPLENNADLDRSFGEWVEDENNLKPKIASKKRNKNKKQINK
jgi:hypothetical protein